MKLFLFIVASITGAFQAVPVYAQTVPDFSNEYRLGTEYCSAVTGTISEGYQVNTTQDNNGSSSSSEQQSRSERHSSTKKGGGGVNILSIVGLGGSGSSQSDRHTQSSSSRETNMTYDRDHTGSLAYQTQRQVVLDANGNCEHVAEGDSLMGAQHIVTTGSVINTRTIETALTERAEIDADARITMNRDQEATRRLAIESNERVGLAQIEANYDVAMANVQLQSDAIFFGHLWGQSVINSSN